MRLNKNNTKSCNKKIISCLAIEVTRRCNLNCDFCAKGEAQSMDITKETIDKTLDEVSESYIHMLRLSGGEPTLAPDLIDYIVDKIIEKQIKIGNVGLFTNGIINDATIIKSLKKLLIYLNQIESSAKAYIDFSNDCFQKVYAENKLTVIISTKRHQNQNQINNAVQFYNQINDGNYAVVVQSDIIDDNSGSILIEGNAATNYVDILKNPLSLNDIRMIDNNYHFISIIENNNYFVIRKTISISANGNVFPGCLTSYVNVDKAPMFNIDECNNNFFDKIDSWCWEHPINETAHNVREKYKAALFCSKNGYDIENLPKSDFKKLELCVKLTDALETLCKTIHKAYPSFCFVAVDLISLATLGYYMSSSNTNKSDIVFYLSLISDLDSENILPMISYDNWMSKFIPFCIQKYNTET